MEATAMQQNAGEVRRLHIIYFISRKGRIEHPHLIRVHHVSRNGVRLRDVKRWLSELRGKDMPESYAWSYKRMYKTGFVWQDLLDEDLITPISDNEYVLKGSEIPIVTFDDDLSDICDEKEEIKQKELPNCEDKSNHVKSSPEATYGEGSPLSMLTKPLLEIEEQSSTFSSNTSMSLTDDSLKVDYENHVNSREAAENHIFLKKEEKQEVEREKLDEKEPLIPNLPNENKKKIHLNNFMKAKKPDTIQDQSSSSSKSKFTKSRSYSNNASNMFRNLLTCGTVDTKDSSMMVIKRKSTSNKPSKLDVSTSKKMAEICRGDVVGGSERISRNLWHETQTCDYRKSCDGASQSKQEKKNAVNGQRAVPPPYKPRKGPNCSQCGKTFDPNQMHKHMKSCRGMKALAKAAAADATTPAKPSSHRRSTDLPPRRPSISSHYLIDK